MTELEILEAGLESLRCLADILRRVIEIGHAELIDETLRAIVCVLSVLLKSNPLPVSI